LRPEHINKVVDDMKMYMKHVERGKKIKNKKSRINYYWESVQYLVVRSLVEGVWDENESFLFHLNWRGVGHLFYKRPNCCWSPVEGVWGGNGSSSFHLNWRQDRLLSISSEMERNLFRLGQAKGAIQSFVDGTNYG
jgi:hypothetical protein